MNEPLGEADHFVDAESLRVPELQLARQLDDAVVGNAFDVRIDRGRDAIGLAVLGIAEEGGDRAGAGIGDLQRVWLIVITSRYPQNAGRECASHAGRHAASAACRWGGGCRRRIIISLIARDVASQQPRADGAQERRAGLRLVVGHCCKYK